MLDEVGLCSARAELGYQLEVAEQLFRFTDSQSGYQYRELSILLRHLQHIKKEDRLAWWLDIRACRRRAQRPWATFPVAGIFTDADEFKNLAAKALLSRLRWRFAELNLSVTDCFSKFDTNDDGVLTVQELTKGLSWLGLDKISDSKRWPEHIETVFRYVDKDEDGTIGLEEFKAALEMDEFDWDSVQAAGGGAGRGRLDSRPSAPPPLDSRPGLVTMVPGAGFPGREVSAVREALTEAMLKQKPSGRYKIKWQTHSSFQEVWTTKGTLAEKPLSIWAPLFDLAPSSRRRLAMGHIAGIGFSKPTSQDVFMLEVTDTSAGWLQSDFSEMDAFINRYFPCPRGFRQMWVQPATAAGLGAKPLYLWKPIPPSDDFVSLGVVATTSDEHPSTRVTRCVPRQWAQELGDYDTTKFWTDAGTGGQPASFWMYNSGRRDQPQRFEVSSGPKAGTRPECFTMNEAVKFYVTCD